MSSEHIIKCEECHKECIAPMCMRHVYRCGVLSTDSGEIWECRCGMLSCTYATHTTCESVWILNRQSKGRYMHVRRHWVQVPGPPLVPSQSSAPEHTKCHTCAHHEKVHIFFVPLQGTAGPGFAEMLFCTCSRSRMVTSMVTGAF